MAEKIHYRVSGYCTTLLLHFINLLLLIQALMSPKTQELETIFYMKWNYITIWNLIIQSIYTSMGLVCDVPVILRIEGKRFNNILESLRWYRCILFPGIVWPCGFFIFIVFWPIFIYDRELIFPASIDTVLSPVSNYIMHSAILPIIVWEHVFAEKRVGKPDKLTKCLIILLYIVYSTVMVKTYIKTGLWPYPMFAISFGTIYFPLIFLYTIVLTTIAYNAQWKI